MTRRVFAGVVVSLCLLLSGCKVIATWPWGAAKYYKTATSIHADDWGGGLTHWWALRQLTYCNEAGTCWDVPTQGAYNGQDWYEVAWCPTDLSACQDINAEAERRL